MRYVLFAVVLLIVTGAATLAAVFFVAAGRGGTLVWFAPDRPAAVLPNERPIVGTDVALVNLPSGLWGYQHWEVDEVLDRLAHALAERDTRIAVLEQRLAELPSPADTHESRAHPPNRAAGDEPPRSDNRSGGDSGEGSVGKSGGESDATPAGLDDGRER